MLLNLIKGEEVIGESQTNAFKLIIVQYAGKFIIPASMDEYMITPYYKLLGLECGIIKAYVRL